MPRRAAAAPPPPPAAAPLFEFEYDPHPPRRGIVFDAAPDEHGDGDAEAIRRAVKRRRLGEIRKQRAARDKDDDDDDDAEGVVSALDPQVRIARYTERLGSIRAERQGIVLLLKHVLTNDHRRKMEAMEEKKRLEKDKDKQDKDKQDKDRQGDRDGAQATPTVASKPLTSPQLGPMDERSQSHPPPPPSGWYGGQPPPPQHQHHPQHQHGGHRQWYNR